ncbi:MAG: MaoC family dehydratase [Promethearchaeota archaeon]|nr:MAG: MaoC family dehydratase [Candidatus Lokiarchaeota archaeon]
MIIGKSIEEFEIGMEAEFSHTFTQEETELMAELIGDHNPFHYECEFVRKTRFKKPIVHGLLVGGMISHFGGDLFPGPGCLAETIEFKFLKPVYFGETIKAIAKITEVDIKNNRLAFVMSGFNERGEKVVEASATCIPYQIEVSD